MGQVLVPPDGKPAAPHRKRRRRSPILGGCLLLFLLTCFTMMGLGIALRSGPVQFVLPAHTTLKLGSDNFVLSNYSFQNGTTYYADLNGSGVRNILEIHLLPDTRRLELVVHHASRTEEGDSHLLDLSVP